MKVLKLQKNNKTVIIDRLIQSLNGGGLNAIPSDTVYGLAVDATNKKAVDKLFDFKSRPAGKAISVFVESLEKARKYVYIDNDQENLIRKLTPGPFTIVLKSRGKLVKRLESEKGTIGIRIVVLDFIAELIKKFGKPITATSANLSSTSSHYSASSFLKSLAIKKQSQLDLVIDWGVLKRNKPSTVVDLTYPDLKILRYGDRLVENAKSVMTKTEAQTKKNAQSIVVQLLKKYTKKPIVILIEGELGVGKTVFIKGVGEYLGIKNIVSPTYVISYEYQTSNKLIKNFFHLDLYLIQEKEEFANLGVKEMLKPGNLICIEWGEKSGEIINEIKTKAHVTYVKLDYLDRERREIKYENISY